MNRIRPLIATLALSTPALAQGPPGPPPIPPLPPVPVPAANPITEAKRVLGKLLFFEEQLSSDDTMACATYHLNGFGGADPRFGIDPGDLPIPGDDALGSPGVVRSTPGHQFLPDTVFDLDAQVTGRTAQTVHGSLFAPELFWDGRAGGQFQDPETGAVLIPVGGALESQAVGPILSEVEMASEGRTWADVRAKLQAVRPMALATDLPPDMAAALVGGADYPQLFQSAFGDPAITAARIGMALATYERTLVPDQTPFDAFLAGDPTQMTPAQHQGFQAFSATTCVACHAPPLFSDNSFRNIGLRPPAEDPGRFDVTGNPADQGRFKTPSLRNVGLRERFMHNGQFDTLGQVVGFYVGAPGTQQFPFNQSPLVQNVVVPPQLVPSLVDFLENALTDPRAANETFPFDRPTLASERKALELIALGPGGAGASGQEPTWIPVAPAAAGSPDFKLGVRDTVGGSVAFLALGLGTAPPGASLLDAPLHVNPAGLVYLEAVPTLTAPDGDGYATRAVPIPKSPSLVGLQLASQWFVTDGPGLAASSGLRWPIQ